MEKMLAGYGVGSKWRASFRPPSSVRHSFGRWFHNQHNLLLLTDGSADWLWPAAEAAGVPLMVLVPGSLQELDRIAEAHPGLKLVIDHVGVSLRPNTPAVWDELPAVCALARRPNVAVKASGMPHWSQEAYPFADMSPHLERLFQAFGPRRMFWGTDLTRMPCTYYECIHMFTEHLSWLKGEDLEWVMGRALCEGLESERSGILDFRLGILDMTLTTRTEVWPILLNYQESPLVGAGFNSFWGGERLTQLFNTVGGIIQAHNGYLETYLNGGLVGVGLLLVLLSSTYFRIRKKLVNNQPGSSMRLHHACLGDHVQQFRSLVQ